jgi:hypothetical protein
MWSYAALAHADSASLCRGDWGTIGKWHAKLSTVLIGKLGQQDEQTGPGRGPPVRRLYYMGDAAANFPILWCGQDGEYALALS